MEADIPEERVLDLTGKRILIVDDNSINIKLVYFNNTRVYMDKVTKEKKVVKL